MHEAERHALAALDLAADHADSYFILCLIYHHQKEWEKLREAASHYIRLVDLLTSSSETPINSMLNMLNEKWRVHLALGDLHIHKHDMPKAEQEFDVRTRLNAHALSQTFTGVQSSGKRPPNTILLHSLKARTRLRRSSVLP
jgi:hypothetical protein